MVDRVGQQLGNYRLMCLLGRGGFAEVYLGQHLRLNMQAAIKVLHTQLANADDIDNFHREAQTIASLIHPHIVRVLDFDVKDGVPFLVMDYAPNGSLRSQHPKGVPLSLPTIISYVKQVADALQYAHEQKLIHRDVKPENMLLERRNEVLLSDFGIALLAQSSRYQSTQEMAGTMAYMAPEQIHGHPRLASDQYSLGIVIYEWLCGNRPFQGFLTEIVAQHLAVPPPSLCEKIPTLAPEVEQVVMTALAKDPRQRFGSVQAFANALEQASRVVQPHSSILSQAPTVPSQPLQPLTITSPAMPLSQQTVISSSKEEVYTPPPIIESRQSLSISSIQNRPEPVRQDIPRRAIVLGLGVAGLAVAGGGLTWLVTSLGKHLSVVTGQTPTSILRQTPTPQLNLTPTPIPLGTLLYTYRGHSAGVTAIAWSPEGRRIASGSEDHTVQVWNTTTGELLYTYRGHSGKVKTVAWSPDGRRIASGGADDTLPTTDNTVQIWEAANDSNVFIYRGHVYGVTALAWSPDSKRIASGSWDDTVQVWDAADGGNVYTYRGHSRWVNAVAWSPDGRRIASGSGDPFNLAADHTVQIWDAADGGNVYTYRGHSRDVGTVEWSPSGQRIASGSNDHTVQVWDATSGSHGYKHWHSEQVIAVAWSPDGKLIASGGNDHIVQVWVAT